MTADNDFPQIMTEEEADRKANMMKAASEVAEAVVELKEQLEKRGWSNSEQAALTLFNTMLMTSFAESWRNMAKEKEKEVEDDRKRMVDYAKEHATERGFGGASDNLDVVETCVTLLMDGKPDEQAKTIWTDHFGEGTGGALISTYKKAREKLEAEKEKDQ